MYNVVAYQIASGLHIGRCKQLLNYDLKFQDSDELFYQTDKASYIYVFQFGMVSFFNIEETEIKSIIENLKMASANYFSEKLSEEVTVEVRPNTTKVEFNNIILPELDDEMIRLVMLNVSQSVALNRYGEITEELLTETNQHTKYLEINGKLDISGNKLKRFIGKALNIKNGILENLYIFDSPEITWENEALSNLNNSLKLAFDLKDRYRRIYERIEIIKENLELFKDIMEHRESSRLEWIIIILILVEVIDLFILKFV
ncbi:RMD1 family protein [Winogradskyella tangerina]|uniref:RMD1 family protein n=1 Tax=Winogradskyella tangerina TaxID=2023240 RepID=UPI000DBE6D38|nr:RMD1 family protein [Winogradskyella tangerina]